MVMDRCWGVLGKEHPLRERAGTRGSHPQGESHSARSRGHSRSALSGRKRRCGGSYSVRSLVLSLTEGFPPYHCPLPDTCTARLQAACLPGPARALCMRLEPPNRGFWGFSCHSGFPELTRSLGSKVRCLLSTPPFSFCCSGGVSQAPVPCALQHLKVNPLFRRESQLSHACSPAAQGRQVEHWLGV